MEREGGERYDTVDREDGRVAVGSGGIRRGALVSPSMPRRDAVDAQEADPLISYDINVLPARVYGDVVERPRQIDREVAFHDRARNRQHLPRVERIVAERELEDLWRDCATDGKKRKVRGELPPNRKDEGSSARSPVRFRRSDIAGGDAPEEERKEREREGGEGFSSTCDGVIRMYRSRLAEKNAWWRRRDSTRNTYIPRRGSPRPTR